MQRSILRGSCIWPVGRPPRYLCNNSLKLPGYTAHITYYCSFMSSCSRESWPTRPHASNAKRRMIPRAFSGLCLLQCKMHVVRPAVWYSIIFHQEEKSCLVQKHIQEEVTGWMLCLQEKGLEAFFKGEKVCGDNKMYCSSCNNKQDADFVSVLSLIVST